MKKFTNFLFVAIMATMVIACSGDYEQYVPELPEVPTEAISFTEDELRVLTQMRNPRICIDEATGIALDALDMFGGGISTRSGQARTIANVKALQSEPTTRMATRSTDGGDVPVQIPDTVAFIFNFADDEGFVIVSADIRITSPVLAFVENGYLNVNEELDHPGLAIFFEGLEEYIEYSIIESERLRAELIAGIMERLGKDDEPTTRWAQNCPSCGSPPGWCWCPCPICWQPPGWCWCPPSCCCFGGSWTITEATTNVLTPWTNVVRGPLLPVEWCQIFPFNHQVPLLCNRPDRPDFAGRAPTGCVATALAKIMAFHRHPAQLDGRAIDWNRLRNFTAIPGRHRGITGTQGTRFWWDQQNHLNLEQIWFRDNVSFLMWRVGVGINTNYRCDGSGASMSNAIAFLRRVGYTSDNQTDFNTNAVVASLNNNRPVLISGYSSRTRNTFLGITIGWTYSGGHAWVVDGHLRQHRTISTTFRTYQVFSNGQRILIDTWTTAPTTQWSSTFLHNDWGWHSSRNGFFVAGSFDSNRAPAHASNTRSQQPHNYQFRVRVFNNIRR